LAKLLIKVWKNKNNVKNTENVKNRKNVKKRLLRTGCAKKFYPPEVFW